MKNANTRIKRLGNVIYTVSDARKEKHEADAALFASGDAAEARIAKKIYTVSDARKEKHEADAALFASGDAAEARIAKKILKALGLKSERKPHLTGLHPRIGTLARWDIDGNPTYYIWQGEDMITSTSVDELMDYLNAEAV